MSQKNTATSTSKFQLDGRPSMKEAVPLGLQHVLAMFVGNIVPMILVASVANLSVQDANMLLQCCMLGAAISTAIQLYPIRIGSIQIGSGLPLLSTRIAFVPCVLWSIPNMYPIIYPSVSVFLTVLAIPAPSIP